MNQINKGKITNIQGSGTFETQHGLFYNWDIQLDNGHGGEYASKNYTSLDSLPFTIGSDIEYEYDQSKPEYPKVKKPMIAGSKRWTPNSNNNSFGNSKNDPDIQLMITRQSSLQRSVEILTHNNHHNNPHNTKVKLDDVKTLAEKLCQWVISGTSYDPANKPTPAKKTPPVQEETTETNETDGLPF